jgi:hypothetical protein
MCRSSDGSFDVKFHTEQKYAMFGKQFMKCYGNLETRGTFSKPTPTDDLTYNIKFSANGGCDTILGDFKVAYEKAFGTKKFTMAAYKPLLFQNGDEGGTSVEANDFTATLVTCGISNVSIFRPRAPLLFATRAAEAAPVAAVNATAIDSQMNYSDTSVPKTLSDAVANVTLFSQAAARSNLKSAGVDITKSDYLKTKQWYDAVISQMQDLGFIAHSAAGGVVTQNTYSGNINLQDIVTNLLSAYLGTAELDEFEAIAKMLSSDPDDTGVKSFLDFWWNAASYHTDNTSVAWGPVIVDQGSPSVTCVYLDMDVAVKDWRSLFVSFHSESVSVSSTAVTLNLDWQVYQSVEQDILNALTGQIEKHVKNQHLDFGS